MDWPQINTLGTDGFLVSFADQLSEPANRAALALRAAIELAGWDGVEETSTSLVSTYLRFDITHFNHEGMKTQLAALLASANWYDAPLPQGRRLWRIPTVFGGIMAPQLAEAAQIAGMTEAEAINALTTSRTRVQTIGFAPGQPYLGELPAAWNIPRQTALTDKVPVGALVLAIRQFTLFSITAPTGWRHVGQTAFQSFRMDAAEPFVLRSGDEVLFTATTPDKLANMGSGDPNGGATCEVLT